MNITETQLQEYIEQIGNDTIVLNEYDYDEEGNETREYKNDDHLFECSDFNIECKIYVNQYFRLISQNQFQPKEPNITAEGVCIENFRVVLDDSEINDPEVLDAMYNRYLKNLIIL